MRRCNNPLLALATCLLFAAPVPALAQDVAVESALPAGDDAGRPELGLMGTIPIYWGEAGDFADLLSGGGEAHWARAVLERDFEPVPRDYLSAEALDGLDYLLMAQPRGLSPEENVALDAWVRAGGRLLLFVDPWMTGESHFGLGDRRRPQDVAMLSPILAYWGVALTMDDAQADETIGIQHEGVELPVRMRGAFVPTGEGGHCTIGTEGLLARCPLGAGEALIVADAAMLDLHDPDPRSEAALSAMLGSIFPQIGEIAGENDGERLKPAETVGIGAETGDGAQATADRESQ